MVLTNKNGRQINGKRPVNVLSGNKVTDHFLKYLSLGGLYSIWGDKIWNLQNFTVMILILLGLAHMFISIYILISDIESCAVIMHHAILVVDVEVGVLYAYFRRTRVRRLIIDMQLSYDYDSPVVSEFMKGHVKKRLEAMGLFFKGVLLLTSYTQINLIIFSVVEWYIRDDKEYLLLYPGAFPFDLSFVPYNILAYLWEEIVMQQAGLTIYGVMAMVFLYYSYLKNELELLQFAIDHSKERALELAERTGGEPSRALEESYKICASMCAEHHIQIIDFYNDSNIICRLVYLIVFFDGLLVCVCSGFALISDNTSLKIKFVGVTVIQLIFIYVMCWFGEKLSDVSEAVRQSIYGVNWYDMPRECHTTFKLMLERTMRPLGFTTLTGQKVDLENYMGMIKASYSYFNMMLAAQEGHC
uniref:Odorant receptor n=1 Tax=Yemma signatus TaxID=300820 RepID=A0A385H524_9HEMI|nr:odorant receptor [Yemma signatus]